MLAVPLLAGLAVWHSQHYTLLSVQTGSMAPVLEPGDAVLLHRVDPETLRLGDVITYRTENGKDVTITHRMIEVAPDGWITTQGDENAVADAPIDPSRVIGRAEQRYPNAGFALDFMRSKPGLIVLVYAPATVLIALEMRRLSAYFQPAYRHVSWSR